MARPLRLEGPGFLYHVCSRGNEKKEIFRDGFDYARFLKEWGETSERFGFITHAYALMPNHYHLLLETPKGLLSRGIHRLNGVYSQYFNRRHERVGHLFQGRFKALIIEAEAYLVNVSRYIHQNPCKARLAHWPWLYPWSSCSEFLSPRPKPAWLAVSPTLERFGAASFEQRREYVRFLMRAQEQDPSEKADGQLALGSEQFVARLKEEAEPLLAADREYTSPGGRPFPPAEVILRMAAEQRDVSLELLPRGRPARNAFRDMQAFLLKELSQLRLDEVAERFSLSPSRVSRIVSRVKALSGNERRIASWIEKIKAAAARELASGKT